MPRLPEHVQRRDGSYHFRMRVPYKLRPVIGKREFPSSLETCDFGEAKRRLALERFKAIAQIEEARRCLAASPSITVPNREFTDEDLWSLMTSWFVQKQKADANLSITDVSVSERIEELSYATDPSDTNFPSGIPLDTIRFQSNKR